VKAEKMMRFQKEENRVKSVGPGLPVRTALLALRFYKTYLSFLFAGNCRFDPTCSRYAYEAIERFGVARGVWLGSKRLLRCHPLSCKFGYDPVSESWEVLGTIHENAGFYQSLVMSHESVHSIHSGNFKIQDEVHS